MSYIFEGQYYTWTVNISEAAHQSNDLPQTTWWLYFRGVARILEKVGQKIFGPETTPAN